MGTGRSSLGPGPPIRAPSWKPILRRLELLLLKISLGNTKNIGYNAYFNQEFPGLAKLSFLTNKYYHTHCLHLCQAAGKTKSLKPFLFHRRWRSNGEEEKGIIGWLGCSKPCRTWPWTLPGRTGIFFCLFRMSLIPGKSQDIIPSRKHLQDLALSNWLCFNFWCPSHFWITS